MNIPVQA